MLNKEKCNSLIKKANFLKEAPTLDNNILMNSEQKLDIILPEDLKYIASRYHYEYIPFFTFYHLGDEVIDETMYYREKHNLDNRYLMLSADGASFLLLETKSKNESKVVWCAYNDFFNLCEGKPMEYNPTIFPSFTDFFEFLIDEEEKMQAEEKELESQEKDI